MFEKEKIIRFLLWLCSFITILTSLSIVFVLVYETSSFFSKVSISDFFSDEQWTPFYNDKHFGILPLLSGTMLVALISSLVAIPMGLTIAIYLSEYASTAAKSYLKPLLEFLAAIPTVVYGYFALTIVTPFLQQIFLSDFFQFFFPGSSIAGFNALSAGIVIGIMITPIVSSLSEDALQAVP